MESCPDKQSRSLKERLKSICKHSLLVSRSLLRLEPRSNLTYLMYHSVPDEKKAEFIYPSGRISPDVFEKQIKYATKNYDVLSIDEYLELTKDDKAPPRRSLVISFDDGYLDNLTTALPILTAYNVPAVIYLATRYVDESEPQWIDRLHSIFKYRNARKVHVGFFEKQNWDLNDEKQQRNLFLMLSQMLLLKTYDERACILDTLERTFRNETAIPRLTLNWDEVRHISSNFENITLAIHTDQHLDLRTHKNELPREVSASLDKLEQATNKKPEHFSYPYGKTFDGAHTYLVEAGIKSAVCSLHDFDVDQDHYHYYINRTDAVKYAMQQWWYINVKYSKQRWWYIDQ